jgi:hypothetical protein
MTKSLLMGMAACVALVLTGPSYSFAKHRADKHPTRNVENPRRDTNYGTRPFPTQFRIPAQPLVWDCVHVMFPQCGRGYDNLNDGSFQ